MRPRLAVFILPLLLCLLRAGDASAAVQFSVTPHSARAAGNVVVRAAHLAPHAQYLLLFVPAKHKKLERLLGAAVTDGRGRFSARLALPPVPYCGNAFVYLESTKKTVARAGIKVTGCGASPIAPPPPPHH